MSSLHSIQATTNASVAIDDLSQCIPAALWMRIVCLVAGSLCIVVGGVGNLTTILSIATVHSLWRYTNINIFLLTISDFIVTTYVAGQYTKEFWHSCWPYSLEYCHFFVSVNAVSYSESLALLALVSYDRYLMVRLGANYNQRESRYTVAARVVVVLAVMLAVILGITNWHWLTGFSVHTFNAYKRTMCIPEGTQNGIVTMVSLATGATPILVMLFCYLAVMKHKRSSTTQIVAAGMISTSASIMEKRRVARARLLVQSIFTVLLVTSSLYFVTIVFVSMFGFGYWLTLDTQWWVNLYALSYPVAWLNNAVNPILYARTMPEFRRAAQAVWVNVFSVLPYGHLVTNRIAKKSNIGVTTVALAKPSRKNDNTASTGMQTLVASKAME